MLAYLGTTFMQQAARIHCCGSAILVQSKPLILLRKFRCTYRARRESAFLAALPHRLCGIRGASIAGSIHQAAARCLEQRVLPRL